MKKRVAIYDLDNTLINTSQLEEYRKQKNWKMVYENFHRTLLDEKVKLYIENLNTKLFSEFFIVTSSPRNYAERLLKYHKFLNGVKIIGYHDTQKKKPSPDPYLKALENIGYYDEVYIFGDDEKDFIAAEELKKILLDKKIFKVGCSWYFKCNFAKVDRELKLEELI